MHFKSIAQFALDFINVIHIFINDQKIIHIHDNVNLLTAILFDINIVEVGFDLI